MRFKKWSGFFGPPCIRQLAHSSDGGAPNPITPSNYVSTSVDRSTLTSCNSSVHSMLYVILSWDNVVASACPNIRR